MSEEKQLIVAWYGFSHGFVHGFPWVFMIFHVLALQFLSVQPRLALVEFWNFVDIQAKALKENVNLNTIATLDDERCGGCGTIYKYIQQICPNVQLC